MAGKQENGNKVKRKGAGSAAGQSKKGGDIAIIGMSCRFPGANDYNMFWDNLAKGVDSIREIPAERWNLGGRFSSENDEQGKLIINRCGVLDNIELFDSRFFNISPREASNMDPQQRLVLEEAWHCIEDSGVPLGTLREKKTSVFAGVTGNDYSLLALNLGEDVDSYAALGNFECMLANRVSHVFGFSGVSISIDAACASSLVAVHEAKQSLLSGESDYAVAAGAFLSFHPWKYVTFSKANLMSPEGHCKAFDSDADGFVLGEGAGMLLLQGLQEAVEAGNHIYGVIKGSAVNHNGHTQTISAPQVSSQKNVILAAYKNAGFGPETVSYVEAHGTGTPLGDSIEIEALTRAFREHTGMSRFCKIGSVKSNIGHLASAGGIAGIIKVLLMMRHGKVPATINVNTLNPLLDWESTPFIVAENASPWEIGSEGLPLRAGVSAFSFGGVNCHVLLEKFDGENIKREYDGMPSSLFALSAKTPGSLMKLADTWRSFVCSDSYAKADLHDMSLTLLTGRQAFSHRYGRRISSKEELKEILEAGAVDFFEINEEQRWCLKIGEFLQGSFTVMQELKKFRIFSEKLDGVFRALKNTDKGRILAKDIQGGAGSEHAYAFLTSYLCASTVIELGFSPSVVIGENSGVWVSLAICNMVKPEEILLVLSGKKESAQVEFLRPSIPFYDPIARQTIEPFYLDEDYVRNILALLDIPEEALHYFIDKARNLSTSQPSFKKYLEEWDSAVEKVLGRRVLELLRDDNLLQGEGCKEKLLLIAVITNVLWKFNQMWDLTGQKRIEEQALYELLDLVSDGVISKEVLCGLLTEDSPDYAGVTEILNSNRNRVDGKRAYTYLKMENQSVPEIKDIPQWLSEAVSTQPVLACDGNLKFFCIGMTTEGASKDSPIELFMEEGKYAAGLEDALMALWLRHVDIKWDKLYHEGTFKKVPLPVYEFEREAFWLSSNRPDHAETVPLLPKLDSCDLLHKVWEDLVKLASKVLQTAEKNIELETGMDEMGFGSMLFIEYSNLINKKYNLGIMPSVFFEHATLGSFAKYLEQEYRDRLVQFYGDGLNKVEAEVGVKQRFLPGMSTCVPTGIDVPIAMPIAIPIAIIGMDGMLPQSEDLEAFWKHLEEEANLVTEIPENRWDWKAYYGDPLREANKTNVKWGGFCDEIDKFDAAFFKISPREAELTDPQQRIFMETVWKTIEDAGYKPSDLSGTKTGLFVGAGTWDYNDLLKESGVEAQIQTAMGISRCMLANRMSYLLNLRGPSESLDTACSSSLVAVHRAVEAIRSGECEMAIAGGVNVLASPALYIAFSKAGMLCEDGRCKAFDKRADGYVRGEGTGALLLKPLSRAEADGDHIYAVIKGNAVNHGGRASSLTAPNANAQGEVIVDAWRKSGIDPSTIGYIEAHGTGTSLGDPIEVNGLKKAFEQLYREWGEPGPQKAGCGLGTVKTNIGHLEAAAGIAGIIKVVLAMKHKKLPASIHFGELNPYINLEDSPFYIVNQTKPWESMVDAAGRPIPRRAGVSSFGLGGVNAHIVLEAYENSMPPSDERRQGPELILLSAANGGRLRAYARKLFTFLETSHCDIADVAYTLQVGREAMPERLAVIARSVEELIEKLKSFLKGDKAFEGIFYGNIRQGGYKPDFFEDEDARELLNRWIEKKKLPKLAEMWVSGVETDWGTVLGACGNSSSKRISLPAYPFERERYWVSRSAPIKRAGEGKARHHKTVYPQHPAPRTATEHVEQRIIRVVAHALQMQEGKIYLDLPYTNYGVDSVLGIEIIDRLNRELGISLKSTDIFTYPTISELTRYIVNTCGGFINPIQDDDILQLLEVLEGGEVGVDEVEKYIQGWGVHEE